MKKPDFLIVGAPKCGTTAVAQYLQQHPEIFMPEAKELHFFGSDLPFNRPRLSWEAYLSHFAAAGEDQQVGEASVWYLYSERAATEIKEALPAARIIIMLRNPVEMLYSLHSQFLYTGHEDIPDFGAALDAEKDRRSGRRIPHGSHLRNLLFCDKILFYQEIGMYSQQVERYYSQFGSERVHVILYEDLKHSAAAVYKALLEFLAVDSGFSPAFRVVNANKAVRSSAVRNVLLAPPQTLGWIKRLLPVSLRRSVRRRINAYNTRHEARPPLDPAVRRRLQEAFAPDIKKLELLIGRDLSGWLGDWQQARVFNHG